MSIEMSTAATEIATLLKEIRDAERNRIVIQNKLDELADEQVSLKERLNMIESQIASTRYAITNMVEDTVKLSLVKTEEV